MSSFFFFFSKRLTLPGFQAHHRHEAIRACLEAMHIAGNSLVVDFAIEIILSQVPQRDE